MAAAVALSFFISLASLSIGLSQVIYVCPQNPEYRPDKGSEQRGIHLVCHVPPLPASDSVGV